MKPTILCPTRGGKSSYPNQDYAIQLAKERDTSLLFLYVSNVQFLGLTALPILVDIETELDEMGDFLLTMAQERAENAGVQAMTTVRRGVFREVLREVIQQYDDIETLVLGSSTKTTGFTTPEYIQELGREISRELGVELINVRQGKEEARFEPEQQNQQ